MRVMKCDMFSRWRERERERCAEGGKDSKQLKQPRFSVGRQYIYIYVYVYIYTHTRILRGSPIQYNICMVRRKSSVHWREWAARIDGWRAFASHLLMSSVNSRRHVFLLFLFSFFFLYPPTSYPILSTTSPVHFIFHTRPLVFFSSFYLFLVSQLSWNGVKLRLKIHNIYQLQYIIRRVHYYCWQWRYLVCCW